MKKLDQFILKSFIGPFFAILLIVVFILMMQFLWLYIDELVGKGLSMKIILEFLGWGSATLLPLSLPLATLLASVMTIGQMGENYELTAMKASGISLGRIFMPILITSVFISIGAFFAANNLSPIAYNKIFTLRSDIGHTKEEIKIPTGTFYDGIDGYVLRIDSRNDDTGIMYGVMVYDHTMDKGNTSITLADSALMQMSSNKDYLTFKLFDGINYQETNSMKYRDTTLQLQKIAFGMQEMVIPLENYAFQKSEGDKFGDQPKTMDIKHLKFNQDSLNTALDSTKALHLIGFRKNNVNLRYHPQLDTATHFSATTALDIDSIEWKGPKSKRQAYEKAIGSGKDFANLLRDYSNDSYSYLYTLRRVDIELLKKFAGALACLIMLLIGAPLGAFIRKGGIGTSAIVAVLFFLLYWVVDISGDKLARDGAVNAAIGAFISTAVMLPIGIYLTNRAIHDASPNTDNFKNVWRKFKSRIMSIFKKTGIVYMGTPEFAVAPLKALIESGYKIRAVVTVADKPAGRGLKTLESPVKVFAKEHGIKVLQPLKLKDSEFLKELAALKADLFVVVGFRMLPKEVWSMPSLGTINLHAALLPQYRGAAPINWAVINGERISGVTTFMIDKEIDTGGIILREEYRIGPDETAGGLHDALMPIGANLVVQTVQGLIDRVVETRVQRSFIQGAEVLHKAPKLTKELCHIDWDAPVAEVYNLIRGLSPYPGAFTNLSREDGQSVSVKIYGAQKITSDKWAAEHTDGLPVPGSIISNGKDSLVIATRDGGISITELQLSGKKRMDVKAFLAGFRAPEAWTADKGSSAEVIAAVKAEESA